MENGCLGMGWMAGWKWNEVSEALPACPLGDGCWIWLVRGWDAWGWGWLLFGNGDGCCLGLRMVA